MSRHVYEDATARGAAPPIKGPCEIRRKKANRLVDRPRAVTFRTFMCKGGGGPKSETRSNVVEDKFDAVTL